MIVVSTGEPGMGSRVTGTGETSVSVREVREVTYRLLCAAGVSPGVASRAAAMVLFSEVHHGDGLLWLYRQLDLIEGGGANPRRLRLAGESEGVSRVEATDTTALVAGPPGLDLLCERAESAGAWAARLVGPRGLPLLREPAYRSASRGLACGVFWSSLPEAGETSGPGAMLATPTPDGVEILESRGASEGSTILVDELLRGRPEDPAGAIREMIQSLPQDGAAGSEAVIFCHRAGESSGGSRPENADVAARGEPELAEEWEVACANGVRVDSGVWGAVYSASRRMLVPET